MMHGIKNKGITRYICTVTFFLIAVLLLTSVSTLAGDEGLAAYWSFDEGEGQMAKDKVGGNHGRLGSAEDADDNDPAWVEGISGKALLFTGEKATYVEVPSSPVIKPTDTITIMAWINTTTRSGNRQIVSNKADSGFTGYRINQSWYALAFEVGDGKSHYRLGGGDLTTNVWHHVAATFNGREMKIYLDGEEVGSKELDEVIYIEYSWHPIIIGNYVGNKGIYPFDGMIDEVRIFNRALSEEEIAAYMKWDTATLNVALSL